MDSGLDSDSMGSLDKKRYIKNSAAIFQFLVMKNLDPDPDLDLD